MTKIILTKISQDDMCRYYLVKFSEKHAVFRRRKNQFKQLPTEAEFGENITEFSDDKKARDFFEKI